MKILGFFKHVGDRMNDDRYSDDFYIIPESYPIIGLSIQTAMRPAAIRKKEVSIYETLLVFAAGGFVAK